MSGNHFLHLQINRDRFRFPGPVPMFPESSKSPYIIEWTNEKIAAELATAREWAELNGVQLFVGEFGCSRDVVGAKQYLMVKICIFYC